ncbi:MAG: SprT-like domain-containing protein [Myxococcaceae bacterium]
MSTVKPKGIYHDIELIYQQINSLYFDNQIEAKITWGRFGSYAARKRSIRLGSYCSQRKRILIHPAMDQACVPRICLERVIHHEMLHQKFPVSKHLSGRRCVHGRQFKSAEQEFRDAALADAWFKDNLKRLLS